ncbi:MAG: TetR/AcrR family transcriptional regulator [Sulfuricurvum sp.]|nr:TetR/AcrR family transcriptional regulator [Sulfuricurvum sp.]
MSKLLHDKIHALKRDTILEAAAKIFEEHGYQTMKITDLAREVKISVGTIYTIFESKDQLYMAYIQHQIDLFLEQLLISTPTDGSADEKLLHFITMRFDICIQKHKAIDTYLINNPVFDYVLTSGEANPIRKIYDYLASLIQPIQPPEPSRSPIELAYLLEGLCHAEVKLWLNSPAVDLAAKSIPLHNLFLTLVKENL